jgi:hypothetical protein
VEAKEAALQRQLREEPPLLLVDIDGVISLFGFARAALAGGELPAGAWHSIDGIPHFLSTAAAEHLLELACLYQLVWASGWEEKADEYLPHLLGLPRGLPHLRLQRPGGDDATTDAHTPGAHADARITRAHWKLAAVDAFAGPQRALAWIDDAFNDACHAWAAARAGRTLLVPTEPHTGLTEIEARRLHAWGTADALTRKGVI